MNRIRWTVVRAGYLLAVLGLGMPGRLLAAEAATPKPGLPVRTQGQENTLKTKWAKEVTPDKVHPEYPRPTLVRAEWLNLNGSWDFGLTRRDQTNRGIYESKILVPFPVESALSGVTRPITELQRLWYRRKFTVPAKWEGRRVLLNFDAVDWEARVWVNGQEMGAHQGGYDRFTFDIAWALKPAEPEQELVVSVYDPTDSGTQPRGKQAIGRRGGLGRAEFHSGCSGIWQTVWLEPVAATSIETLKLVPDIDRGLLNVTVRNRGETDQVTLEAVASFKGKVVGRASGTAGQPFPVQVPSPWMWTPDEPQLYDLKVTLKQGGRKVDEVASYFGMRKITVETGPQGVPVMMLNNQPLFQFGPLDQGYWPEGLYTAPTDEAVRSDIEKMKEYGFNLCRKHLKVEPERWYYWCDTLGLLVWQDMPSGDKIAPYGQNEIQRRPASAQKFELELERLMAGRGNHPSIVMWVPFHDGWGRYETMRILPWVKGLDPSRVVLSMAGLGETPVGDVQSVALRGRQEVLGALTNNFRASVVGECAGYALIVPEHVSQASGKPRPGVFLTSDQVIKDYRRLVEQLRVLGTKHGLSGTVFKQWSDVEQELDGLLTYDRTAKYETRTLREINRTLAEPAALR